MQQTSMGKVALAAGGMSALLASACCLGPLLLVSVGLGGAWIGNLTLLEPYRPWFLGSSFVAIALAARAIFRPAMVCVPEQACAAPEARRTYKIVFWLVIGLVIVAVGFPYVVPFFY